MSKSLASWRSCNCSDSDPAARLTMRPRLTAGLAAIMSTADSALLSLSSILARDFVVVQGAVLVVVVVFALVNLATDVLYSFLNPRIRAGNSG